MQNKIIIGIASIKVRRNSLQETISSLRNQTLKPNLIVIYLNDYLESEVPKFLKKTGIHVYTGDVNGDRGDAGKFFKVSDFKDCYYFSCDDDLKYPENYIRYMIHGIEKYGRQKIVALHGSVLKGIVKNFFRDRNLISFKRDLKSIKSVHLSGTGLTAFHTDAIKLDISDFKEPNMADIWLGVVAQRQNVGMIVLPHKRRWVGVLPKTVEGSIFNVQHKSVDKIKICTDAINLIKVWKFN